MKQEKPWAFKVVWRCSNCHNITSLTYPKGTVVPDFKNRHCPVCGVTGQHWAMERVPYRDPRCEHMALAKEKMKSGEDHFQCRWCEAKFEIHKKDGRTWVKRIGA